jgi:hypothetical protein
MGPALLAEAVMGERETTTRRSVAGVVRENSTWLTLIVIGVILFGIPRVEAAGFPNAALALYVIAFVGAVVLLVSAIRELRERL